MSTTSAPQQRHASLLLRMLASMFSLTALCAQVSAATVTTTTRERISLNAGWRFHRGDPENMQGMLDYDVRPRIVRSEDGKVADAKPEDAEVAASGSQLTLKPWILPTANAFIADATHRHPRPAGDPGNDAAFIKTNFDDRD